MTSPNADNMQQPERCPICEKQAAKDYAPFCSKRCADIDLHRWLSGAYAIPCVDDDGDAEEELEDEAGGGRPN